MFVEMLKTSYEEVSKYVMWLRIKTFPSPLPNLATVLVDGGTELRRYEGWGTARRGDSLE